MNTLIYKRTHKGDPNEEGIFGIHNCMGRIRSWSFDAVIGVGGKSPWQRDKDIAFKITWIGINPHKTDAPPECIGFCLKFECFILWDETGPDLKSIAPNLFRYMFEDKQVRHVMSRSLTIQMQEEVTTILKLAEGHQLAKSHDVRKQTSSKHKCCT